MTRLSRSAKRDLTTTQLLETAKAVFLERGYHRASLDDIAEAAGFTKGAVYSRYSSKDEMFLALLDQRYAHLSREFASSMAASSDFGDWLHREARRVIEQRRSEGDWYLLLLEFWIHAARDGALRQAVAQRHNRVVELLASAFSEAKAKFNLGPAWSPLRLARAGNAMLHGYTLERMLDPAAVPENLIESMFELLIEPASRRQPKPARKAAKTALAGAARRRTRRRKSDEPNSARTDNS